MGLTVNAPVLFGYRPGWMCLRDSDIEINVMGQGVAVR